MIDEPVIVSPGASALQMLILLRIYPCQLSLLLDLQLDSKGASKGEGHSVTAMEVCYTPTYSPQKNLEEHVHEIMDIKGVG